MDNPEDEAYGVDVDKRGNGTVNALRLYQLMRQPKVTEDRELETEFVDAGLAALVFTFDWLDPSVPRAGTSRPLQ